MVFATLPQKPHQKTRQQLWKKQSPKHRLLYENHTKLRVFKLLTNKPPKNKRHTPCGGRRTCYLVVVVAAVVVVVEIVVVVVVAVVVVVLVVVVAVVAVAAMTDTTQALRLFVRRRQVFVGCFF